MPPCFPITRDDEFYVFLKASIPADCQIESLPSTSYYSEWLYNYSLYRGGKLLRVFEGDFRTTEKGTLVREALAVLESLEKEG